MPFPEKEIEHSEITTSAIMQRFESKKDLENLKALAMKYADVLGVFAIR